MYALARKNPPLMKSSLTVYKASAGSGKTFTLAVHYMKLLILAEEPGEYARILAVTFTNKATAEMKDRILAHLYALGQGYADRAFLDKVQQILRGRGCALSENAIRARAALLFEDMLAHYDDIQVTTIDSFLQLLLSGLAQSLGLSANFAVELDVEHVITSAVDQLLSTHIDEQEGLADTISSYLTEQMDDEAGWDIRQSLRELASELFKEAVQESMSDADFDRNRIRAFKTAVSWTRSPDYAALCRTYESLHARIDEVRALVGGKNYAAFVERVGTMVKGRKLKSTDKPLGAQDTARLDRPTAQTADMYEQLRTLNDLFTAHKEDYMRWYFTTEHLNDMMLLTYLRNRILTNLQDANSVLLAETAHKLAAALRPGDADFILERAGIRFRHILLDEFQDTSTLQWDNFCRLIRELLSGGGTTLIVGDTKQSIYRWRNGNRHIMEHLETDFADYARTESLRRNFRSRREVVQFNLQLFSRLPSMVETYSGSPITLYDEGYAESRLRDYYVSEAHEGGLVHFRAYPYDKGGRAHVCETIVTDMFVQMEELLSSGVPSKDILILIRRRADAAPITRLFRMLRNDRNTFPHLSRCEIVSADSFTLDGSRSVNVAICGLKYILRQDSVARAYIRYCCPEVDWEALGSIRRNLPLTEMLEDIIRLCLCKDGVFQGDDILYLNSLQDKVRDYVGQYGANAEQFITYWDDSLHAETIGAAETDAIRLMTIHKAKGLEAKNVFVPFCDWEMHRNGAKEQLLWCVPAVQAEQADARLTLVPVSREQSMQSAGYAREYEAENDEELIDNLNLLYVALTRAADRLFVSADLKRDAGQTAGQATNAGSLLLHACGLADAFSELSDGTPFVAFTAGQMTLPDEPDAPNRRPEALPQPFSFKEAETIQASYRLSPVNVEFRQSQDSFVYTMYGAANGQANLDRRAFGNICHDILARAERQDDVPHVIDLFARQGIIRDATIRAQVEQTLSRAWQHEQMCDWFSGRYTLLREDTILLPARLRDLFARDEERSIHRATDEVTEQRPDRVMTEAGKAIVLDYKFGAMNERIYFPQVRRYMRLMRELGYTHVEGYIWAAETNELIAIKEVES